MFLLRVLLAALPALAVPNAARYAAPNLSQRSAVPATPVDAPSPSCFPALGFTPPPLAANQSTPAMPRSKWWCSLEDEQGFLGFSYYVIRVPSVELCMNVTDLIQDFTRMRTQFHARYVRLYSWCDDNPGFFSDVITAAYHAGIGVYATVWFGFDLTDQWMSRRDNIIHTIETNPLAPYVVRSIDVGSEPLFDGVLPARDLAAQVSLMQTHAHPLGIIVSVSEMQWAYIERGADGSQAVLDAVDVIHAHQLPFFDWDATTADHAWPSIQSATDWLLAQTNSSKKIIFTQTGWPSNANAWLPNSPNASATVRDSNAFAALLDDHCELMKARYGRGGVGWFWQIWDEQSLPGWGWVQSRIDGPPKVHVMPRTRC